jgi:hypothetical protein
MERPTSASAFADRRMLILFLTIFIDLMGFGIFIPVYADVRPRAATPVIPWWATWARCSP